MAYQYDLSYINHTDRSLKSLKEVRWNISEDFHAESLREYHGLVYNSLIQNAQFLNKRKFKKFNFVLEDIQNAQFLNKRKFKKFNFVLEDIKNYNNE